MSVQETRSWGGLPRPPQESDYPPHEGGVPPPKAQDKRLLFTLSLHRDYRHSDTSPRTRIASSERVF